MKTAISTPLSARRTAAGCRPLRLASVVTLVAAAWPAHAQEARPAARLDPVVITGSGGVERRAFDTPAAVSVVDADELRSGGLMVNLSETLARVPGLTANLRNNYAQDLQISSRGYGARATFGIRGIRLYTDGIPAAAPDGSGAVSHFDIAGAQRIEVLRGPFSALYGNSSGGVISLVSAPPTERAFMVDGDVGRFGTRQVRLGVEAPFGDGFSIRAQASRFQTDNFRDQAEAERDLFNVRLGWAGARDTVTVLLNNVRQPADDPQGLTREQFEDDPYQTAPQPITFDTRKIAEQTQIGTQWKHRFDGVLSESQLVAYAGKRSIKQWQSIPTFVQDPPTHPGGVIDLDRDYHGVDARLVWRWSAAQLVAGFSVEEQKDGRRGYENFTGDSGAPTAIGVTGELRRDETNRARTTDVYAQGEIELGHNISATLGVRSGRLRVESDDDYVTADNPDDSGSRTFRYTNPVAALQWKPSPNLNVYVSAGRGYESPTLNEMAYQSITEAGFNTGIDAQRSRQIEIGTKWRNPDAGVGIDVAVFRTTTRDEIGVEAAQGGRTVFGNVGRTERKGIEVGGRWQVTETVRTLLALTYLDAKYTDGENDGNRIAGTMKNSAFLEAAWAPDPRTEVAAELRRQGDIPVNDGNDDHSDSVYLLGLRAGHFYDLPVGRLELLARIENVTDQEYAGSVIVNDGNGRFFEPGTPRSWLLSARWRVGF